MHAYVEMITIWYDIYLWQNCFFSLQFYKDTQQPIPYYKLIIDPDNMMNTFDNAFQLSFLFRDANIGFIKGSDGLPAIYPVFAENKAPPSAESKQFIATLDFELLEVRLLTYQ